MIATQTTNRSSTLLALLVVMIAGAVAFADTYTVTNTDDSGAGSLRWAIESANDNPGWDLIRFNIPGAGPHTIQPGYGVSPFPVPLPYITDPVTIDGYTQPGANPATGNSVGTLRIELDGTYVDIDPLLNGLTIDCGGCTVRGLVINRFAYNGIHIRNAGGNVIEGNYIGTDVTGMMEFGYPHSAILIWDSSGNMIGGTTPGARNVIAGNDVGVTVNASGATGNTIQGNYFGLNATGTVALGSAIYGVHIIENACGNTVGPGNVISGANTAAIDTDQTIDNLVQGNLIGTDASGMGALGNYSGIRLGSRCTVRDNLVSHSDTIGIGIGGDNNTVTGNTFCFNLGFGIQLEWANNNSIYNNNFIGNHPTTSYQVVDHGGTGNVFTLPKPIGGNYWSEWTGPDQDCDGFVDLPYPIWTVEGPDDYSNQDDLPWVCEDGWRTGCDRTFPALIDQVKALDLPTGTENSLIAKLENAAKKLADGNAANDHAAINSLEAFINEVEAQRGKKIPEADADALITAAQAIIEVLLSL